MKPELTALISLHDVMPETFPRMEEILRYLKEHKIPPITLYIVPGKNWTTKQINRLHQLVDDGFELAAHGWLHHAPSIKGAYHRIHSTLISRDVAEHLALDEKAIVELMSRSGNWFNTHGFSIPALYVPPAWALGSVDKSKLSSLPFSGIEVLRGILNTSSGNLDKMPMVGFETDSYWREFWVRAWNKQQMRSAHSGNKPLRIGIHPHDFSLRMGKDLRNLLSQDLNCISYGEYLRSS